MKLKNLLFPPEPVAPPETEPDSAYNVAIFAKWQVVAAGKEQTAADQARHEELKQAVAIACREEQAHRAGMGLYQQKHSEAVKQANSDCLREAGKLPGVADLDRALAAIEGDQKHPRRMAARTARHRLKNHATNSPQGELLAFVAETKRELGL